MKNIKIRIGVIVMLSLLVNCFTFPMGQFKYIEPSMKDAQSASKNEIGKACGMMTEPLLEKAFQAAKMDSVQNASIVFSSEGLMTICYTVYGDKLAEVKKEKSGKK